MPGPTAAWHSLGHGKPRDKMHPPEWPPHCPWPNRPFADATGLGKCPWLGCKICAIALVGVPGSTATRRSLDHRKPRVKMHLPRMVAPLPVAQSLFVGARNLGKCSWLECNICAIALVDVPGSTATRRPLGHRKPRVKMHPPQTAPPLPVAQSPPPLRGPKHCTSAHGWSATFAQLP